MPTEKEQIDDDGKLIESANKNTKTPTKMGDRLKTQSVDNDLALKYELKNIKVVVPRVSVSHDFSRHSKEGTGKKSQCKKQTARKSIRKENTQESQQNLLEGCDMQPEPEQNSDDFKVEQLKVSAKILNFNCARCKDSTRYSPNDLQKHYQLLHYGELPTYPCEMCSFSANDFQAFKQHRHTHRSTLVKCEICNDDTVYTLLQLTKHYSWKHCVNGHFRCEKCKFSTKDVGTFVQHIHRHNEIQYKCVKCSHVSYTKGEFQRHLVIHTGSFPFTCQYCDYGATRKDYLLKHFNAVHKDQIKDKPLGINDGQKKTKTATELKLVLRRYKTGASRKGLWRRKRMKCGTTRTVENGLDVCTNMRCTEPYWQKQAHSRKEPCFKKEKEHVRLGIESFEKQNLQGTMLPFTIMSQNKVDVGTGSNIAIMKNAIQGPTVLMVRNNKISVPANYSAKFMGFKMVDGKQHLVIKLLPAGKQTPNTSSLQSAGVKDSFSHLPQNTLELTTKTNGHATVHGINHPASQNHENQPSVSSQPFSVGTHHSGRIISGGLNTVCPPVNKDDLSQSLADTTANSNATQIPIQPVVAGMPPLLSEGKKEDCKSSPGIAVIKHDISQTSLNLNKAEQKQHLQDENVAVDSSTTNESQSEQSSSQVQGLLPFHNYSKIGILDDQSNVRVEKEEKTKSSFPNCTVIPQTNCLSNLQESLLEDENPEHSSHSSLNADMDSEQPKTAASVPSSEKNLPLEEDVCDSDLNTKESNEISPNFSKKKEQVADPLNPNVRDVDSSFMPKINSVLSLQNEVKRSSLTPAINGLQKDEIKTPTVEGPSPKQPEVPNNTLDHLNISFTGETSVDQTGDKTSWCPKTTKQSNLISSLDCEVVQEKAPNEGTWSSAEKCFGKETRCVSALSPKSNQTEKMPPNNSTNFGSIVKTHSDAIINQQLVKDRIRATSQGASTLPSRPLKILGAINLAETSKPVLIQPSQNALALPLHLAGQPGLQVHSGPPLCLQMAKVVPMSLPLNKKPGMILTFSNGTIGALRNVGNSSQVLGGIPPSVHSKTPIPVAALSGNSVPISSSKTFSLNKSVLPVFSTVNGAPINGPFILTNSLPLMVGGLNVAAHSGIPIHQGKRSCSSESGELQNEVQQKYSVCTVLPDGRQAVVLKCLTPNKPVVPMIKTGTEDNVGSPDIQLESGSAQQKILLKIVRSTSNVGIASTSSQSVNSLSSLQLEGTGACVRPAMLQKQTVLLQSGASQSCFLMPANSPVMSSTGLLQCSSTSAPPKEIITNVSTSSEQGPLMNSKSRVSKQNTCLLQMSPQTSDAKPVLRSKRQLKRKLHEDFEEPPKKKRVVRRKYKEKKQTEDPTVLSRTSRSKVPKDIVRTLRLLPFTCKQLIKCPQRNQPVVVLNHPDADVPEVVNVMKTINKFKGQVVKVVLSKRTVAALLEPSNCYTPQVSVEAVSVRKYRKPNPISPVKERFVLKLTLKKTSKNNYQIVKTTSDSSTKSSFSCWFCGRMFDNQDDWVGHGQRHLMEATRDWNTLV
uniref:Zinc finger protein 518A n=1 Tax=Latimeria chalumnae TaxID=7897 RepID=H3A6I8_LATCH